jgi:acetyl esterase/lipase
MSLQSDLTVNASKFDRANIDEETLAFNEKLIKIWADGPRWYEVRPSNNLSILVLFHDYPALDIHYPRVSSRMLTYVRSAQLNTASSVGTAKRRYQNQLCCQKVSMALCHREIRAAKSRIACSNQRRERVRVFICIFMVGGGCCKVNISKSYSFLPRRRTRISEMLWNALTQIDSQDPYLKYMADNFHITVVSIGYRLAPEDPWPACANDCYDAAEYLIQHGKEKFGGELMFTGGESAGGHLACLVALHLLNTTPSFGFKGLLLHFGCFDLSTFLPHVLHHESHLVIDHDIMSAYIDVLLPNTTEAQRRDPSISPFYADLRGKKLPPALFTCGSEDPLLDDTVMMGAKWQMWGNEAVVKVYNGAPHGFIGFAPGTIKAVQEVLDDVGAFVKAKTET